LGIGDWGLGIGPNPQSPIPNPQSPSPKYCSYFLFYPNLNKINLYLIIIKKFPQKRNAQR